MKHFHNTAKRIFFLIFCFIIPNYLHADSTLILKVERIFVGDGRIIDNAVITCQDGKITHIGKKVPSGARAAVIDCQGCIATPGFIAGNAYMNVTRQGKEALRQARSAYGDIQQHKSLSVNEEASEVTPQINLLYVLNPQADDFEKAWRNGITCVYIAPGNSNVINGTGIVIRTAGDSVEDILVKKDVHLKITFGPEPAVSSAPWGIIGLFTRRPKNRMGVSFVIRDAFFNALQKSAESSPPESDDRRILNQVLQGKMPARIRAKSYIDIKTALRLMDEFGYRLVLEDGTDAYRYIAELKRGNIPVVYGPVYRYPGGPGFNTENEKYVMNTPLVLARNGIRFAFQNSPFSPVSTLRDDAIYAVQLGLPPQAALKALTSDAAAILGIGNRLGKIEKGKDADILIFDGDPFAPTSSLKFVVVKGNLRVPDDSQSETADER